MNNKIETQPIPNFINKNLPAGIHLTSWEEFKTRFGLNHKRQMQIDGLQKAIQEFRKAGCTKIYIDGSFVTDKRNPGDYDALYDLDEVNVNLIDERLLDSTFSGRDIQKRCYEGEFFPMSATATSPVGLTFIDFFQRDKKTKEPKGIIRLDLR